YHRVSLTQLQQHHLSSLASLFLWSAAEAQGRTVLTQISSTSAWSVDGRINLRSTKPAGRNRAAAAATISPTPTTWATWRPPCTTRTVRPCTLASRPGLLR